MWRGGRGVNVDCGVGGCSSRGGEQGREVG